MTRRGVDIAVDVARLLPEPLTGANGSVTPPEVFTSGGGSAGGTGRSPQRVRAGHVAWLHERLSGRDLAILDSLNQLGGLLTGRQLERLHFADLAEGRSRTVSRSRTLARLVRWRVLVALPRRVGGAGAGSTVAVFALDTGGARVLRDRAGGDGRRIRRPGRPGDRHVGHALAVAELGVQLVEADRRGELGLRTFEVEPRWPDGRGGLLSPDAYVVVTNGRVDSLWWVELDRATESLPTVRRKLRAYRDFAARGGVGPRGAMPRVLVSVPDEHRARQVRAEVAGLPPPAAELVQVARAEEAVALFQRFLLP